MEQYLYQRLLHNRAMTIGYIVILAAFLTAPMLHGAGLVRGFRLAIKAVEETFVTAFQQGSITSIVPNRSLSNISRQAAREATTSIAGVGAISSSKPQAAKRPTSGELTVETTPENANIRIMNIKPTYNPGINLKFGSYDIEVSSPGFRTKRFPIKVEENEVIVDVNLTKRGSFVCEGEIVRLGGIGLSEFGLIYRGEQVLPDVSIYEVFTSLAKLLDKEYNFIHGVTAYMGDNYAYLTAFQNSNLTLEQVQGNKSVKITERKLEQSYGVEKEGNDVRFVHYLHLDGAYSTQQDAETSFCNLVESI